MLATLWGSLVPGGVVILKENCCQDETFSVDVDDASVTQSLAYWQDLIYQAGLRVVRQTWQEDFPEDIFPVPMLALQPRQR
jgi:protein N-terminal methyltransferase